MYASFSRADSGHHICSMNNETMEAKKHMNTQTEVLSIFDFLPFRPTKEQEKALYEIAEFTGQDNSEDFYILAGAAGTGKTSMLKAVVDYLEESETGMFFCPDLLRMDFTFVFSTRANP